ncbi:uncharacterized protein [Erythrolamprus reginae]|uniref:uncharacterized protein n=1 Tax=Erythrolamprus reginae TaxID=121349 RepID=UPI00396C9AFE
MESVGFHLMMVASCIRTQDWFRGSFRVVEIKRTQPTSLRRKSLQRASSQFVDTRTGEIVSTRGGRTHRQNTRRFDSKKSSNTRNHPVNQPAKSQRPNFRNASPSARDSSPKSFRFGKTGNHQSQGINPPNRQQSSSNRKKTGYLPSYLDNLPNAQPPPWDSPQKQGYHPRSQVKSKNSGSSSRELYNQQNPQLGQNNHKTKWRKSKDMFEAASEIVEDIKDLYTPYKSSEGGNSISHDANPADSKRKGDEVKYVVGETVRNAPVEDPESYILGSPIAKMDFRFNDSEEKRWNENRHRFATHVYHPNSIQPISREGVALANSLGRASGHNPQNNAVSDLHFSFENALFLIHPFAISIITLITPFLIF